MMTDLLKDLEAVALLAEKATPGEWARDYDNDTGPSDDYYIEWQTAGPAELRGKNGQADADYITALSNLFRTHHAEIAEAVSDARRLDWLERNVTNITLDGRMHLCMQIGASRISIDAAMHNSAREVGE